MESGNYIVISMKPSKNNVYCIRAQHTKMLFPTESKANNFIRFNAEEIQKENGFAPVRSYFCESCGGWHVTSHEYKTRGRCGSTNIEANYLANRRSAKEREYVKALTAARSFIGSAVTLMNGVHYVGARRFLCYAENVLNNIEGFPVQEGVFGIRSSHQAAAFQMYCSRKKTSRSYVAYKKLCWNSWRNTGHRNFAIEQR